MPPPEKPHAGFKGAKTGKPVGGPGVFSPAHRRTSQPKEKTHHGNPNMGNGASATQIVIDGEALDLGKIKALLPELRHQLKQATAELERCQIELEDTRLNLKEKDQDTQRLKEEVHKLKSVLQATIHKDGKPDILSTIHEENAMAGQDARGVGHSKKQGVSGESSTAGYNTAELKHFDKDFR